MARMTDQDDEKQPLLLQSSGKAAGRALAVGETQIAHPEIAFNPKTVSYFSIFRFASYFDMALFSLGMVCAMVQGALLPASSVLFGNVIGQFTNLTASRHPALIIHQWEESMVHICVNMAYLGLASLVVGYCQITAVTIAGTNILHRLKKQCFSAFLRQNIAWFDQQQSGKLQSRLVEDLEKVRLGVSDKTSIAVQNLVTFVGGLALGFYYSWQLALVVCSLLPLMAASAASMGYFITGFQSDEQKHYAEASGVANETISSMRTVAAFCKQDFHLQQYKAQLTQTKRIGIRKGFYFGVTMGSFFLVMFSGYALAFWYGPRLIVAGKLDAQSMMTSFFAVLTGAMAVGQSFPGIQDVSMAKGAAGFLLAVIDRKPPIDASSNRGVKPGSIQGNITFRNVDFFYPTRPDVQVLKSVSFEVNKGQTVALVGHSGCGKSTCVSLLQRFYDASSGDVLLDGVKVQDLNISWLRENIGVVSQEPVLFGYSIAENIAFGKLNASREEVERAARLANAHHFISRFERGYDTQVGERGAQLSGGQKQRIAIARALVRDPKIILLDEATSALDTESEKVVQDALNRASEGRTTIVVAHRLSTIRDASNIVAFNDGAIKEQGTHDQLMARGGLYASLVRQQNLKDLEDENEENDERKRSKSRSKSFTEGSVRKVSESGENNVGDSVAETKVLPGFTALLSLNKPEWYLIVGAILASMLTTGSFPLFSVFFGNMMNVLSEPPDQMQEDSVFWACMFLVLGAATGFGFLFQMIFLSLSGERLTERLRQKTFASILSQDISFFDDPDNSTGTLTAKLGKDAALIQGATGVRVKSVFDAIVGMAVGLTIAFYFGWQLALLILAAVPLLMLSGGAQAKLSGGYQTKDSESSEKGGKIISESLANIRTVQSLGLENQMYDSYFELSYAVYKKQMRNAHVFGLVNGLAFSLMFFIYASSFRLATYLIINQEIEPNDSFKVIFALMFSAFGLGQAMAFVPDYAKARVAADNVLRQLNCRPVINDESSPKQPLNTVEGRIEFIDVGFSYPQRQNSPVLKGIDLVVNPGERVALVGFSGCGKSTLMQLLLRFYDPTEGEVRVDGHNLTSISLSHLRSHISIVSQEPTLFSGTIKDNIIYGADGTASEEDIISASKMANAYEFISRMPDGFETKVGEKGAQLSGGQKQRIAIARAILRRPKVLLLDEATSALDSESEKVVQDALEKAQQGRTCLVIAHRLSTVQNCDRIAVIDRGVVHEVGTHRQLLANKALYYKLSAQQNLEN